MGNELSLLDKVNNHFVIKKIQIVSKKINNQSITLVTLTLSVVLLVSSVYWTYITTDPLVREFSKAVAFICLLTTVHLSTIIKFTSNERIIETANN